MRNYYGMAPGKYSEKMQRPPCARRGSMPGYSLEDAAAGNLIWTSWVSGQLPREASTTGFERASTGFQGK